MTTRSSSNQTIYFLVGSLKYKYKRVSSVPLCSLSPHSPYYFAFLGANASLASSQSPFMSAPNLLSLFLLTLLLFTSSSLASPMPSRRRPAASAAASSGDSQYQVLDVKKMQPYVLASSDQTLVNIKNRRRSRQGKMVQVKRPAPAANEWGSRPFSAMLPKGYVPPSGSSSCHNAFPSSINFYCGESAGDP